MPYDYVKPIVGYFMNDKVVPSSFQKEIEALELASATIDSINADDDADECTMVFDVEPDAADKAAVDGAAAAHAGVLPTSYKYHATSSLVEAKAIVDTQDWDYMASAVTTPTFFMADLTKFVGRVIGACKTVGAGAELRVLEDSASKVMGAFTLPDTGGEWAQMQFFSTELPSPGTHEYILEGRLDGATSAEIRGTSMTILEAVQSQVPSE